MGRLWLEEGSTLIGWLWVGLQSKLGCWYPKKAKGLSHRRLVACSTSHLLMSPPRQMVFLAGTHICSKPPAFSWGLPFRWQGLIHTALTESCGATPFLYSQDPFAEGNAANTSLRGRQRLQSLDSSGFYG